MLKGLFSLLFLILATKRLTAAPHNFTLVSAASQNLMLTSNRDLTTLQLPLAKAWPVPERLLGTAGSALLGLQIGRAQGPKAANI